MRETAWRVLVECEIAALPVDLNIIVEWFGAKAYPYQGNWNQLRAMGLEAAAQRTAGMAFYRGGIPYILYDSGNPPGKIRFTIAHELGHIALGHLLPGAYTVQNQEPQEADNPREQAANQFAVDLLAPACVLWGMGVHTAPEIAAVCGISAQAAQFRAQQMELLRRRNQFLSHSLERVVYRQFQPFITGWAELL